jgi:uncharacterized membrane protein HdeD (DUF308 family)
MQGIKTVRNSVKHWYILLIVGLIFLAGGIYSFVSPENSFLALALFFGWSFVISGAIEIVFSISNRDELENWGWTLIFGIITFLVGVLLIAKPGITELILAFSLGFLVLFRSIGAISFALDLKNYEDNSGWGTLLAFGILGVLFSFLLLWNPSFAGMTIVFWIGLALISAGIFSIYLSLKLRKLKGVGTKISTELRDRFDKVQEEIKRELGK